MRSWDEPLETVEALERHEAELLALVNHDQQSAELYLLWPLRFLRERGFRIEGALAKHLDRLTDRHAADRYEAIERGHAELFDRLGMTVRLRFCSGGSFVRGEDQ